MKNTVINFAQTRSSHTFLIRQNVSFRITASKFNCKILPRKSIKSKSETVEHFKLLGFKISTIYRTIGRFKKQEKVEKKIGSGKYVLFHRLKFVLPWRNKQRVAAQNRIVNWDERSKFIITLTKSIWQRWEATAMPKHLHLNHSTSTIRHQS
jgi:predicted DNA-binding transcriptional regulator AlpA